MVKSCRYNDVMSCGAGVTMCNPDNHLHEPKPAQQSHLHTTCIPTIASRQQQEKDTLPAMPRALSAAPVRLPTQHVPQPDPAAAEAPVRVQPVHPADLQGHRGW
jgi:hypothetical protein